MIVAPLIALAAVVTSVATLERQDRQDTVSVLSGDQAVLEKFRAEVGDRWTGGELVEGRADEGVLYYWAYSDRTAAEARALMLPAIAGGLLKGIANYSDAVAFPTERLALDEIAVKCAAKSDPFFVSPKKTVELTLPHDAKPQLRACLSNGEAKLNLPLYDARKRAPAR